MEEQQMNPNVPQANPAPAPENQGGADQKDVEENKLWAILGYLGILCLIPLLGKKDSRFAQFHAKQGLILLIGEFFVWVPFFGWLLGIIIFVLWIMGIVNVLSGKMKPLPIVGELARKLNI